MNSRPIQPIHTLYGGAHLFNAETPAKLARLAAQSFATHAPTPAALAEIFGLAPALAEKIHPRVAARLAHEAIEDLRVDFEDGFGLRPDAEEDAQAARVGSELARAQRERLLPRFIGIRIKSLSGACRGRAVKTFHALLESVAGGLGRGVALRPGFLVTLPKIENASEVALAARLCDTAERAHQWPQGTLKLELMIETPRSVLDERGPALLRLVEAGAGRVQSAHIGSYDYTASLGVTANRQRLSHPACDFAKHVTQVAGAQLVSEGRLWLSDGATTLMPVGAEVRAAWRQSFEDVRHSLDGGWYQGWDLHPAQVPARLAALQAFYLEALEPMAARLRNFNERAQQASLLGAAFDDAATGRGLNAFFARGLACGALTPQETAQLGIPAGGTA